jgi:hypothetical protein
MRADKAGKKTGLPMKSNVHSDIRGLGVTPMADEIS